METTNLSVQEKEKAILNFVHQHSKYIVVTNKILPEMIDKIYELFILDKIDEKCKDSVYYVNLGFYYDIKKDVDNAKKYYEMASELGNIDGIRNLGNFYYYKEDYDEAEEQYNKGIELGDKYAVSNMGVLYYCKYNNIDMAIKYWEMAIKLGDIVSMFNMGVLYETINDIDKAEINYKIASDLGYNKAMCSLGNIHKKRGKYDEAIRHYKMSRDLGNEKAIDNLQSLLKSDEIKNLSDEQQLSLIEYNIEFRNDYIDSIKTSVYKSFRDKQNKISRELRKIGVIDDLIDLVLEY